MKYRKITALILCLTLVCSLMCISGFAAEESSSKCKNYVALGDSVPSGYGLYYDENGKIQNPKGLWVDGSYPVIVADYLGAENITNLCRDGFTTVQALRILDKEYDAEFKADTTSYEYYADILFRQYVASTTDEEMAELQEIAPKAIAEADVITLEFGNNDTFSYALCKSIIDYLYTAGTGEEAKQLIDTSFISDLEEKFGENEDSFSQTVATLLGSADFVANLLVNMADAYIDYIPRFDRLIERIRELNPDAEIYVVGMYNPIQEVVLSDDIPINVGRVFNPVVEIINLYADTLSPNRSEYIYVDVPDTETYDFPSLMSGALTSWANLVLPIHPTANGHEYIAEQIISAIENNNSTVPANLYAEAQDIDLRQYYVDFVNYALQHNIMAGNLSEAFDPDGYVTKAMVAKTLYDLEFGSSATGENEYADILDDMWYTDAMLWAAENGIISADENGELDPMAWMTQEDIEIAVTNYQAYKGV